MVDTPILLFVCESIALASPKVYSVLFRLLWAVTGPIFELLAHFCVHVGTILGPIWGGLGGFKMVFLWCLGVLTNIENSF